MKNNEQELEEQDHPLKNTDRAFVQVGKDGEPVMPTQGDESEKRTANGEKQNINYDRP